MTRNVDRFKKLIEKANNIVITTHIFPDADGIGSEIALCMALRKLGKNAICINEEKLFTFSLAVWSKLSIKSKRLQTDTASPVTEASHPHSLIQVLCEMIAHTETALQ